VSKTLAGTKIKFIQAVSGTRAIAIEILAGRLQNLEKD
jgi:hypothetical protein